MKKVLFTATVDSHILQFHLPFLKLFKENGYEVHVATNGKEDIPYCDYKHTIPFERSPFKLNNIKAIIQLKKIIDTEKFNIIHTHTPMGSVVTRLAAKNARKKYHTRVIYTAHGLHFFKGAPLKNWLLFYPVEKYLSKYTDTLILINQEDFDLCKRKFKKCKDIQYVPGVGIDESKFNFTMSDNEKVNLRNSLGLKKSDFVMIYAAELSKRKRQIWLINSIKDLLYVHDDIHLLLPGKDSLNGKCQKLVNELNLENQIHFLGYRSDIPKLLKISNLALSSANQEGLPVNILEALYVGLPVVATNCRGNRDLIKNGVNGFIIEKNNVDGFADAIMNLYKDRTKYEMISKNNLKDVNKYYLNSILERMNNIYFETSLIEKKNDEHINITFGIPMYNSEKYIGSLLDCFQKSKMFNYEILIINDGSTDNSVSKCLEKKNLPIRIINQKNSGVSASRNKIIKEAKGDYIAFIDSDDLIFFAEYECALMKLIKEDSDFLIPSKNMKLTELIEKEVINSPIKIYKAQLLKENEILFDKEISIGEDLLFNLNCYNNSISISFYDNEIYNYRKINNNSLTTRYRSNKFEELMYVYEKCNNIFYDKKIKKSLEYIRIKNSFSCLKSEIFYNKKNKFELKKYIKKIKHYKKFRLIILNTIKANCMYYMWYLLPSSLLIFLVKKTLREVK